MKSFKEYRFEGNPIEKEFHDKFKSWYGNPNYQNHHLSLIVFGMKSNNTPFDYLSEREENICLSLIQWLGSPVGQGFLDSCGFAPKNND
jgi:hypothetical protein